MAVGQYDIGSEINAYCDSRTSSHFEFEKVSPIYANLVDQNNKALAGNTRSGGLDQKTKVLMLIGMHVASGSRQSIEFSVSAAIQVGAKEDEILDAIDMALLTRGGQSVANAQFAFSVLKFQSSRAGGKPDRFEFIMDRTRTQTQTGKK